MHSAPETRCPWMRRHSLWGATGASRHELWNTWSTGAISAWSASVWRSRQGPPEPSSLHKLRARGDAVSLGTALATGRPVTTLGRAGVRLGHRRGAHPRRLRPGSRERGRRAWASCWRRPVGPSTSHTCFSSLSAVDLDRRSTSIPREPGVIWSHGGTSSCRTSSRPDGLTVAKIFPDAGYDVAGVGETQFQINPGPPSACTSRPARRSRRPSCSSRRRRTTSPFPRGGPC